MLDSVLHGTTVPAGYIGFESYVGELQARGQPGRWPVNLLQQMSSREDDLLRPAPATEKALQVLHQIRKKPRSNSHCSYLLPYKTA